MTMTLGMITRYPAKSMRGDELSAAQVEKRGLQHDRRFMLVDELGAFITAREEPALLRVVCRHDGKQLWLSEHGERAASIPFAGDGAAIAVKIWRSELAATAVSQEADAWFSAYLGRSCQLVYMGRGSRRPVDPDFGRADDEVSFADGFPLHLISQAALDTLNERLSEPLSMRRFRPNLVIRGCSAHAEDQWRRIRIGNAVELELPKPCIRCVIPTLDPDTGQRHPERQPLRALATYRRDEGGKIFFGMNAIPRTTGRIEVGDPVTVLEVAPPSA